jgi:vacuolar protein-sorting-associated protein 4
MDILFAIVLIIIDMADNNFLQKGIEKIKIATEYDQEKKYPEAYRTYLLGIEYFTTALKYTKYERHKQLLRKKIDQYLNRAEEINKMLQNKTKKIVINEDASCSSHENNMDYNNEKDEDRKLRKKMDTTLLEEVPNVKWDDIAGLEEAKSLLKETVILPLKLPELFNNKVREPWRGILLYGPPGTGKSYLAKAVATEAKASFFSVTAADLTMKYLGDSEKQVRHLFELARERKPAVIFVDEIDSICSNRDGDSSGGGGGGGTTRMKTEFMIQMNGVNDNMNNILVLAATNRPWILDPAIRRRFEKRIYIPLPNKSSRKYIFQHQLKHVSHTLKENDIDELTERTEGYSGADIKIVIREASMEPVRMIQKATHFKKIKFRGKKQIFTPCSPGDPTAIEIHWETLMSSSTDIKIIEPLITMIHFKQSLKKTKPTVNKKEEKKFNNWTEEFGELIQ